MPCTLTMGYSTSGSKPIWSYLLTMQSSPNRWAWKIHATCHLDIYRSMSLPNQGILLCWRSKFIECTVIPVFVANAHILLAWLFKEKVNCTSETWTIWFNMTRFWMNNYNKTPRKRKLRCYFLVSCVSFFHVIFIYFPYFSRVSIHEPLKFPPTSSFLPMLRCDLYHHFRRACMLSKAGT